MDLLSSRGLHTMLHQLHQHFLRLHILASWICCLVVVFIQCCTNCTNIFFDFIFLRHGFVVLSWSSYNAAPTAPTFSSTSYSCVMDLLSSPVKCSFFSLSSFLSSFSSPCLSRFPGRDISTCFLFIPFSKASQMSMSVKNPDLLTTLSMSAGVIAAKSTRSSIATLVESSTREVWFSSQSVTPLKTSISWAVRFLFSRRMKMISLGNLEKLLLNEQIVLKFS